MQELDPQFLRRYEKQPTDPNEVRYNCPYCGDVRGKLYLNFKKGQWICFHCGKHGSILPRDVVQVRGEAPQLKGEPKKTFQWETHHKIIEPGLTYLRTHNIDNVLAFKWGVRSGKKDLALRLVFPSRRYTPSGMKTVFRSAHSATTSLEPKTLHEQKTIPMVLAFAPDGENPLYYPTPQVTQMPSQFASMTAILVEGPSDAFRLFSTVQRVVKFQRAVAIVALWGKHLSEEDAFDLARGFHSFYIMLDRERGEIKPEGETMASLRIMATLNAVSDGVVTRHLWSKKGTYALANDPAELAEFDVVKALRQALVATGEYGKLYKGQGDSV